MLLKQTTPAKHENDWQARRQMMLAQIREGDEEEANASKKSSVRLQKNPTPYKLPVKRSNTPKIEN